MGLGQTGTSPQTLCHCPFCTKSQREEDTINSLNQRLKIETKEKVGKTFTMVPIETSMGACSPKLLDSPVPTRRILLVNRPFFRIWGYYASPAASCKTTEKHHTPKATFEPEPSKWNECCSQCPSCSIIKYGDTSKYLFTVEMVGTSGAATMIFFFQKTTICHSTCLWKYNFNIGFFKIKRRLWQ